MSDPGAPEWLKFCVRHWVPIAVFLFWFSPAVLLWFWESHPTLFDRTTLEWFGVLSIYAGLLGLMVSALTFIYAFRGADSALKNQALLAGNQNLLVDHALVHEETLQDFNTIFDKHLLHHLSVFENVPGRIYLMLSSPAYGYGVLGKEKSAELSTKMDRLRSECTVHIIYYSPDAHWLYWANTLLWSFVRRKFDRIDYFAREFAVVLRDAHTSMVRKGRPSDLSLWVSDSGQHRLFGFQDKGKRSVTAAGSLGIASKAHVYVVVADRIDLGADQWGGQFHARSHRVFQFQVDEYIFDENSVFERAKFCPYSPATERSDQATEGAITAKSEIDNLFGDYLYGRTGPTFSHPLLNPSEVDRGAIVRSITDAIVTNCQRRFGEEAAALTVGEYLRETLLQILDLFTFLCGHGFGSSVNEQSEVQTDRIETTAREICALYDPQSIPDKQRSLVDWLTTASAYLSNSTPDDTLAEIQAAWIGELLASGRGTSRHYSARASRATSPTLI